MFTREGFEAFVQRIIACGVDPDLAGHYAACIGHTPHIVDGWVVAGSNAPGKPPPIRLELPTTPTTPIISTFPALPTPPNPHSRRYGQRHRRNPDERILPKGGEWITRTRPIGFRRMG